MVLEPEGPRVPGFPRVPPHPTALVWDAVRSLSGGGPLLLPEGCAAPSHDAPRSARASEVELATERLISEDVRLGKAMLLPFQAGVSAFEEVGLPLRLSRDHIAAKALTPKGRLVVHFKDTNAPAKKPLLAATYGAMKGALPSLADYCELAVSATEHFAARGEHDMVVSKSDCAEWFKRVRLRPEDCGHLAYTVWINSEQYLVIPGVNQFGSQDSGYHSLALTSVIAANDRHDDMIHFGIPVSLMFADDDAAFLPRRYVAERRARHAARVHQLVGSRGLNPKKNVDDAVNDVVGYAFNLPRRDVALAAVNTER